MYNQPNHEEHQQNSRYFSLDVCSLPYHWHRFAKKGIKRDQRKKAQRKKTSIFNQIKIFAYRILVCSLSLSLFFLVCFSVSQVSSCRMYENKAAIERTAMRIRIEKLPNLIVYYRNLSNRFSENALINMNKVEMRRHHRIWLGEQAHTKANNKKKLV